MKLKKLSAMVSMAVLSMTAASAFAQSKVSDDVVKIGVLTDLSGLYADIAGKGSVEAVKMAVEDFGGKVLGKPIEVISADHQNKADIASTKTREWIDTEKVDLIQNLVTSSTAIAAVKVAAEKKRIAIVNGAASSRLSNEDCTAYSIHYTYDTVALANGTGKAVVKQGGDTWFFLTADYAFGKSLEKDVTEVVKANGGKVLGSVAHPLNSSDFSSFLLQAQSSGAKIIGLANAGGDTINSIKAANEFGVLKSGKQKLAGLLVFISDIHALGLAATQGLYATEGFYWDLNDETRKWSDRFFKRTGKMPTMVQAGDYSSTMHYLKAVQAAGTDNADEVIKKMKSTPVNDFFAKNGVIREDGRMVHDMYLVQVKTPAESKKPWDYYHVRETIPGNEAYRSLANSTCPLIKK